MDRRSYLGAAAAALSFGVAGCVASPPGGDDRWAGVEPTYPDDRDLPAGAATHHLYVENADEEPRPLALTVVRTDGGGDGETLVWRAGYEAPDGRGFEVPDLLVEGRTYRVTVALADDDRASTTRTIDGCPHDGGSRNLGAWVEDATVSFRQDDCDELVAGATLPTGDHRSFLDG